MSARDVAFVLAGILGSTVLAVGLVFLMVGFLAQGDRARARGYTREQVRAIEPPSPRLQVTPLDDFARYARQEQRAAGSYEWIGTTHTHARIPVSRAMVLMAGRSLDGRP